MASQSDHLQALEMRLGWLRWIESGAGQEFFRRLQLNGSENETDIELIEAALHNLTRTRNLLAQGSTYYLTPAFCQLVDQLRRQVPDDLCRV